MERHQRRVSGSELCPPTCQCASCDPRRHELFARRAGRARRRCRNGKRRAEPPVMESIPPRAPMWRSVLSAAALPLFALASITHRVGHGVLLLAGWYPEEYTDFLLLSWSPDKVSPPCNLLAAAQLHILSLVS